MDAHYDQVQQARARMTNEPRWYFAYTTSLDIEAFENWKSQHGYSEFSLPVGTVTKADGYSLTFNFPSRFWGGRVAALEPVNGSAVWGMLFSIAGKDWPIIQHKEGVITGMSVERSVEVLLDGKVVNATAFVTNPNRVSTEGPVSQEFVAALVRGAKASGLPQAWIETLERHE
jgi:gamma-glutamylcyclotransferase